LAPRRSRRLALLAALAAVLAVVLAAAGLLIIAASSKPSLSADPIALARVHVPLLAGTLERATATSADGTPIALAVRDGRITPLEKLTPGERVSVEVVIRRPAWLGWAIGASSYETLTLRAPTAEVTQPWITLTAGTALQLHFNQPLAAVAAGSAGHLRPRLLSNLHRTLSLGAQSASGTIEVATAARTWERLGVAQTVTWFPPASTTVALASPAPGVALAPTGVIRLTFSRPLTAVFGAAAYPSLTPTAPGAWRAIDSHTLQFTPTGTGYPLAGTVRAVLPSGVAMLAGATATPQLATTIAWPVAPGSTLRLQQLLAQQGYLPLDWTATATTPVARTALAQTTAAVSPPAGNFTWRYPHTPAELQALWKPGEANIITRGAVMAFEHNHDLTADGIAGPNVWHTLLDAAIAGTRLHTPYSYVYVHRSLPQSLTLWSAGHKILSSPGNTGIPQSPTKLGTFAVFEHLASGTMKGTNPDGTKYDDPGVRFISYFNGGDALHAFPRASYGTPQSLGCVELPLAAAEKVWPYTPIGTLVTIEN
jgi:peptidoglycan hydrolase-like protein with peptidoglycan-binding domain